MLHQLPDHPVPLARDGIACAVLPVGDEVQEVVEAHLAGDALQDVDAEAVEAAVAGEVLGGAQHDEGVVLGGMHMQGGSLCLLGFFLSCQSRIIG